MDLLRIFFKFCSYLFNFHAIIYNVCLLEILICHGLKMCNFMVINIKIYVVYTVGIIK